MTMCCKVCSLLTTAENRGLKLCSTAGLFSMIDLDFRMIWGHPKPDQAEGNRQPLINVHLNILTGLRGRKGKTACKIKLRQSQTQTVTNKYTNNVVTQNISKLSHVLQSRSVWAAIKRHQLNAEYTRFKQIWCAVR